LSLSPPSLSRFYWGFLAERYHPTLCLNHRTTELPRAANTGIMSKKLNFPPPLQRRAESTSPPFIITHRTYTGQTMSTPSILYPCPGYPFCHDL
uniref:Uncharacterized protein n=1 Tax=Oncorhynchus mykiss TaxID=8022 RepID=A0A8K9X8A9_ONCMY